MGLSLGEITALCFANSITFEDAVMLTKLRGQAMLHASKEVNTGMISIMGVQKNQIDKLLNDINAEFKAESIFVANILGNENFTLAGTSDACNLVSKQGKKYGAKLLRKLPVSGAFHTIFMKSAEESFRKALPSIKFSAPEVKVISNIDGIPYDSVQSILTKLPLQITHPVLWDSCLDAGLLQLEKSDSGPMHVYEIGPGDVCSSILKRKKYPNIIFETC